MDGGTVWLGTSKSVNQNREQWMQAQPKPAPKLQNATATKETETIKANHPFEWRGADSGRYRQARQTRFAGLA
jgi:hypothetical protein